MTFGPFFQTKIIDARAESLTKNFSCRQLQDRLGHVLTIQELCPKLGLLENGFG